MHPEIDQQVTPSSHRGRRIGASLIGAIGTFAIIISVLGFFVLSFIGSSAAASSSIRSALAREDVRRAIAEELVDTLEEGGDNFARTVIGVAHDRVVDAVEVGLNDNNLRNAASDSVASAYEVFINDAPSATIDIQVFVDSAFSVIRSIDPQIVQILSPQVDPLEISQDDWNLNVGGFITAVRVVVWALLFGGLALLAISWLMSVDGKWHRLRRIGIRFLFWGIALTVVANVARNVTFGGDRSGPLFEALVLFVTSRLQTWSIVIAAIGFIATLLGVIMSRRATST
ncbi:MAG: hypothetical protein D4R95_00505 [Actinobacteria bacterium]|nr:MAG: hypothetical protein D4R95_00505 [Actinomycetota bacterium]